MEVWKNIKTLKYVHNSTPPLHVAVALSAAKMFLK